MNLQLLQTQTGTNFPLYSTVWDPAANKPIITRVQWGWQSRQVLLEWNEGAPEQNGQKFRIYKAVGNGALTLKAELEYSARAWLDPEPLDYGIFYTYQIKEVRFYPSTVESHPATVRVMATVQSEEAGTLDACGKGPGRTFQETLQPHDLIRTPPAASFTLTLCEYPDSEDRVGRRGHPASRVGLWEGANVLVETRGRLEARRVFVEPAGTRATPKMPGGRQKYRYDLPGHEDVTIWLFVFGRRLRLEGLNLGPGQTIEGVRTGR